MTPDLSPAALAALVERLRESTWMSAVYPHWTGAVTNMADAANAIEALATAREAAERERADCQHDDIWWHEQLRAAEAATAAACRERDEALSALREVEWVFDREETCHYCAACSRVQRDGHTPDCVVAAALTP